MAQGCLAPIIWLGVTRAGSTRGTISRSGLFMCSRLPTDASIARVALTDGSIGSPIAPASSRSGRWQCFRNPEFWLKTTQNSPGKFRAKTRNSLCGNNIDFWPVVCNLEAGLRQKGGLSWRDIRDVRS